VYNYSIDKNWNLCNIYTKYYRKILLYIIKIKSKNKKKKKKKKKIKKKKKKEKKKMFKDLNF